MSRADAEAFWRAAMPHENFGGVLPTRAQDVPHQRAVVARNLRALAPHLLGLRSPDGRHDGDFGGGRAHVNVISEAVDDATLYYVERDMCDLVEHAWRTIPATTLVTDLPPEPIGFVMFARAMTGLDADHPDLRVTFHALLWTWVTLTITGGEPAISIIMFTLMDSIWSPLGRTDWPLGCDTDDGRTLNDPTRFGDDPNREQRLASQIEDRRMLATLWLLAAERRLTSERRATVTNKAARRRFEREHRRAPAAVRVIDVRRPERDATDERAAHDVEWSRRWIVSGHWRQQAYGEGRKLRRPTWIAPFVKGPGDKPLVVGDRVKRIN